MGEVLSQSEIDSLLQALSTGELDADEIKDDGDKVIKEYDFKRPAKFSKEHLRTLEIIYEHYSRLLSTNLPVYLRKNIQVNVINSETVTFSEFTNSLLSCFIGNYRFCTLRWKNYRGSFSKISFCYDRYDVRRYGCAFGKRERILRN